MQLWCKSDFKCFGQDSTNPIWVKLLETNYWQYQFAKSLEFSNMWALQTFKPQVLLSILRILSNDDENGDGDVRVQTFYFFFNKSKHESPQSVRLVRLGGS